MKTITILLMLCLAGGTNLVSGAEVVSLYGDKDGMGIGLQPDQYFDPFKLPPWVGAPGASDPPNTDTWIYGDSGYWTHEYDLSGLGQIQSAWLEIFAGGLGSNGAAAPIFINGKFLGNLKPMEIEGNLARISYFDLMPFVNELTGSTTFSIGTSSSDGWILDYAELLLSDVADEPEVICPVCPEPVVCPPLPVKGKRPRIGRERILQ